MSENAVVSKANETSASSNPPKVVEDELNENAPLIDSGGECRICQEEDSLNNLEVPCACNGSVKYAHRKCVQHWCNEKGDITCEICQQTYQPGYTVPRPNPEETIIDIAGGWQLSGTPLDLHDARLLAITEADHQFLEAEYDDYHSTNASGAAFCRSAALILMALLLLRHTLSPTDGDDDDDPSILFSLFLLRAAGFLLPCYIMIWAISILHTRRQRQEAAARAPPPFAFVVQSRPSSSVHFAIASAGPGFAPAPTTLATIPLDEHVWPTLAPAPTTLAPTFPSYELV